MVLWNNGQSFNPGNTLRIVASGYPSIHTEMTKAVSFPEKQLIWVKFFSDSNWVKPVGQSVGVAVFGKATVVGQGVP